MRLGHSRIQTVSQYFILQEQPVPVQRSYHLQNPFSPQYIHITIKHGSIVPRKIPIENTLLNRKSNLLINQLYFMSHHNGCNPIYLEIYQKNRSLFIINSLFGVSLFCYEEFNVVNFCDIKKIHFDRLLEKYADEGVASGSLSLMGFGFITVHSKYDSDWVFTNNCSISVYGGQTILSDLFHPDWNHYSQLRDERPFC
ncbi:hypothetical protein BDB01DRAFT_874596 [Pilobolus umbonatus]|nr:hypothetical protein BDB01DRAFT_874596 [Pilobolus umbonatus]